MVPDTTVGRIGEVNANKLYGKEKHKLGRLQF